jgi:hypothetical protein
MEGSLPVVWTLEGDGRAAVGKLELLPDRLRLDGRRRGRRVIEEFLLSELLATRFGRDGAQRIGGRATLVIERSPLPALLLSSVFGVGILRELADRLAR